MREIEKGRIIYMPEDSGEVLFILKRGRVQLYRLSADGRKLVLSQRQAACVGGALAIDANGNETVGPSSCTVTQPFCVNP